MKVSNRYILLISILFSLCLCALAFGQEKTKILTPTEVQSLRLQVKQKDALLAKERLDALQVAVQTAQKNFQDSLKALTDEAETVKKEQGWPKETQFDPNSISFTEPPKEQKK